MHIKQSFKEKKEIKMSILDNMPGRVKNITEEKYRLQSVQKIIF